MELKNNNKPSKRVLESVWHNQLCPVYKQFELIWKIWMNVLYYPAPLLHKKQQQKQQTQTNKKTSKQTNKTNTNNLSPPPPQQQTKKQQPKTNKQTKKFAIGCN